MTSKRQKERTRRQSDGSFVLVLSLIAHFCIYFFRFVYLESHIVIPHLCYCLSFYFDNHGANGNDDSDNYSVLSLIKRNLPDSCDE